MARLRASGRPKPPCRTATRAGTSSCRRSGPTRPHFGAGRWLNYLGDDQAHDAVRAAYGPNYERLREVKRRYDPKNVFHLNHNIAP